MDGIVVGVITFVGLEVINEVLRYLTGRGISVRLHLTIALAAMLDTDFAAALVALWAAGEIIRFGRKV